MKDEMAMQVRIAVIGDFEAQRPSHKATSEALVHGGDTLGLAVRADGYLRRNSRMKPALMR